MSKGGAFGGSETTGNRHTGSGSRSRMHMEGRRMLSGGGGVRKGWKRMVASITLLVILVLDGATSQSEFPFLHHHPPARAPRTHPRAHTRTCAQHPSVSHLLCQTPLPQHAIMSLYFASCYMDPPTFRIREQWQFRCIDWQQHRAVGRDRPRSCCTRARPVARHASAVV